VVLGCHSPFSLSRISVLIEWDSTYIIRSLKRFLGSDFVVSNILIPLRTLATRIGFSDRFGEKKENRASLGTRNSSPGQGKFLRE